MKEKDKITDLFRNRLGHAEMAVRDGFWEELQRDLPQAGPKRKHVILTPNFYRVTAAASVLLVLGAASAALWFFSPKEEIKDAFTQVATLNPEGSLKGDVAQENFPSIHEVQPAASAVGKVCHYPGTSAATLASQEDPNEESMTVSVSIRVTQRGFGNSTNVPRHNSSEVVTEETESVDPAAPVNKKRRWALKVAAGSSVPKGGFRMPLTAGITVEHCLNKLLALEAGLQYNCLPADGTLHTLALPVKLNVALARTSKVDVYATLGGAVEKCIAGAPDNGFGAEPLQLSVIAGLGVRYKLTDRFALFAEPSVSHYFDTDSQTKTLRTERAVNMNLLCGVRMTY